MLFRAAASAVFFHYALRFRHAMIDSYCRPHALRCYTRSIRAADTLITLCLSLLPPLISLRDTAADAMMPLIFSRHAFSPHAIFSLRRATIIAA